jgi:hypothetical protein
MTVVQAFGMMNRDTFSFWEEAEEETETEQQAGRATVNTELGRIREQI